MFKRILIGVDGSNQSKWAQDAGAELAAQLGGQVALVHVMNNTFAWVPELAISEQRVLEDLRQNSLILLKQAEERLPATIEHERILREGEPAEEITAAAREWNADLLVLGTHARGNISRFLLGSTAGEVLRNAPCPVLMVREQATATRERT